MKSGKSMNIVNNLESNFFRPGLKLQSKVPADQADGTFNSAWLDANQLGTQQAAKAGQKRVQEGRNKTQAEKPGDASGEKMEGGQQLKGYFRQFRQGGEKDPA